MWVLQASSSWKVSAHPRNVNAHWYRALAGRALTVSLSSSSRSIEPVVSESKWELELWLECVLQESEEAVARDRSSEGNVDGIEDTSDSGRNSWPSELTVLEPRQLFSRTPELAVVVTDELMN